MTKTITETDRAVKDLESQRQRLGEDVTRLKNSIKYWQNWEAEYEGLKEELQKAENSESSSTPEDICKDFGCERLDQKGIEELLYDATGRCRRSTDIVGLLSRRLEYVESNIKTLGTSLELAEDKLAASKALSPAEHQDAEGFPLMEIQEELDEDGNTISGSASRVSDGAPQVVEALRKAGVNGLPDPKPDQISSSSAAIDLNANGNISDGTDTSPTSEESRRSSLRSPDSPMWSTTESESDSRVGTRSLRRRKSVTFADDTKQPPPEHSKPSRARDVEAVKLASTIKRTKFEIKVAVNLLDQLRTDGVIDERTYEHYRYKELEKLKRLQSQGTAISKIDELPTTGQEQQNGIVRGTPPPKQELSTTMAVPETKAENADGEKVSPVIPTTEPFEDARLRREMLKYHLNEVGAVVAEMNLDEDDTVDESDRNGSLGEDEDASNTEDHNSNDEDEDKWGRTKSRVLSDEYVEKMRTLEKQLNATSVQNAGPKISINTLLEAEKDLVAGKDGNPVKNVPRKTSEASAKKGVRFAKELDIQEAPNIQNSEPSTNTSTKRATTLVHTDIVERSAPTAPSPTNSTPPPKAKQSRFKTSKSTNPHQPLSPAASPNTKPQRPQPTGPPGRIQSPKVIERPYSSNAIASENSPPVEPDEFDPSLLRQELNKDYHRTRNRMIQRQGGFLAREEDEENDNDDLGAGLVDENGKRVSRFKAARMRKVGG